MDASSQRRDFKGIGERIRKRREALGLLQKNVAEAVGRSQASVAAWESGTNGPSVDVLPKLAICIQCSVEYILYGEQRAQQPVAVFARQPDSPAPPAVVVGTSPRSAGAEEWHVKFLDNENFDSGEPVVADLQLASRKGLTGDRLAGRLRAFDFEVMPDLDDDHEPPLHELALGLVEYSDTWRLLFLGEKIIGYWRFVPLNKTQYNRARRGVLLDKELTRDAMEYFGIAGTYNIYIAFMGILREFRNARVHDLFFSSFFDVIDGLSKRDIYIGYICANGLTETGRKMCRGFGMQRKGRHKREGIIFESTMRNLLRRRREKSPRFLARYRGLLGRYSLR